MNQRTFAVLIPGACGLVLLINASLFRSELSAIIGAALYLGAAIEKFRLDWLARQP